MNEKLVYHWLRSHHPSAHWQRVENTVGTGVPDVNGCKNGVEVWVELKEGVKLSSGIVRIKIRREQNAWLLRRHRAGGLVYLGIRVNKHNYILGGEWVGTVFLGNGIEMNKLIENSLDVSRIFTRGRKSVTIPAEYKESSQ